MKKYEKVKNNLYFNKIINKGKIIKTPYFNIFYLEKKEYLPCFGIAVGKKIGNAVTRNNIKRRVRLIIDNYKYLFPNNKDYIIIVKEPFKENDSIEYKIFLEKILKEVK